VVLLALLFDVQRDFHKFEKGTHRLGDSAFTHTLNKLTGIAANRISPRNPELAKCIVDVWLPSMMDDFGIEMALQQVVEGQWQDIVS